MDMQGLTNAVESANRLSVILEREFEALKKQSLDVFEKIQPEKTEVILALSKISTSPETKALAQGNNIFPKPAPPILKPILSILPKEANVYFIVIIL